MAQIQFQAVSLRKIFGSWSNSHKRQMQEAVCDSVFDSFMCALAVLMYVMVIVFPQLVDGEMSDTWEWF